MRFVVAGSSGFLGTALRDRLARDGHEVVRLIRGDAATPSESSWDPYAGEVDAEVIAGADVVVNLAGAPIERWPWTDAHREQIRRSRVESTATLAAAVAAAPDPPVLLAGSGASRYGGDRGGETLPESSSDGTGFLAEVVRDWETATAPAAAAGARVCHLRTTVVLGPGGGAFALMSLPFRLGLGGTIGSGEQYFPAISLSDWVSAVLFLAATPDAAGAYNLAAPEPVTNAEFTAILAERLHRPARLRAPASLLRAVLGDLAQTLLGSLRVVPERLLAAGFSFEQPDMAAIVRAALRS